MEDRVKIWLFHIRRALEERNSFLPEKKVFLEFKKDIKTKRAFERNMEIIGEAVSRIVGVDPSIEISNPRKIIATRNRISWIGFCFRRDNLVYCNKQSP